MKTRMTALELILHLAEGSTTPNTLQHITKIAREALEAAAQQESVATLYGSLPVYDKPAQQDLPDLIAGALGVSRGTAYDLMREALEARAQSYESANPLGGPAKVFDAMANAIRAGDEYHAVLRQYGFAEIAAAQPAVPLTDEQINTLRQQYGVTSDGRGIKEFTYVVDFARAIEAAHGIKENT